MRSLAHSDTCCMERRYTSRNVTQLSGVDRRRVVTTIAGLLATAAACLLFFHTAAARQRVGEIAFGLLLSGGFYLRWRSLVVTADERGVRSANWLWNRRWDWENIIGFDYAQGGKHFEATKYFTGRVLLSSGKHGWLEALTGSTTGDQPSDARARAAIEALNAELARRRR